MQRQLLVLAAVMALAGCTPAPPGGEPAADPLTMQAECVAKVAAWAGVSEADVTGANRSDENPSGEAWDFDGSYPGGSWRCGGPAGQPIPVSVVVYPDAGGMQDILQDGSPPQSPDATSDDPEAVLAALVEASEAPSTACVEAMRRLADTPYSASEAVANAAIAVSVEDCTTAAEYILAFRQYPAAWGLTDASFIDGSAALITIQSACFTDDTAPMCVDAAANGLL